MTWDQFFKLELLNSEFRTFQGEPKAEPVYSGRYEFNGTLYSVGADTNRVLLVGKTANPKRSDPFSPLFVEFVLDPKNGSPFFMARYSIAFVIGVGKGASFGLITEVNRMLFKTMAASRLAAVTF